MEGAAASLQGVGVDTHTLMEPYLRGARHRAGRWTLAHAHQLPLSHPPRWRHWAPAVRTEGGDEVEDNTALGTPEHGLLQGPQPALTTAVLSMEAVGWMYTFPATQGRGGSS